MEEQEYKTMIFRTPKDVYLPSDDSYMLEQYARELKGRILEIGCGNGLVSISNAKANPTNTVLGADINPSAVSTAEKNAELNKVDNVLFLESNLFENLEDERFDAIIFNPPYLPTSEDDKVDGDLNAAFDGGKSGREVLDLFLEQFEEHLKPRGVLLILHSSLNNLEETISKLEKLGMKTEVLAEKSFFFEKLMVLKATNS